MSKLTIAQIKALRKKRSKLITANKSKNVNNTQITYSKPYIDCSKEVARVLFGKDPIQICEYPEVHIKNGNMLYKNFHDFKDMVDFVETVVNKSGFYIKGLRIDDYFIQYLRNQINNLGSKEQFRGNEMKAERLGFRGIQESGLWTNSKRHANPLREYRGKAAPLKKFTDSGLLFEDKGFLCLNVNMVKDIDVSTNEIVKFIDKMFYNAAGDRLFSFPEYPELERIESNYWIELQELFIKFLIVIKLSNDNINFDLITPKISKSRDSLEEDLIVWINTELLTERQNISNKFTVSKL